MSITKATAADIPQLKSLINGAYRGEESKKGWTTEEDILDGIRIDETMLVHYFNSKDIVILKYTDDETQQITGTVYLEIKGPKLYLGMLCVSPALQGKGTGKLLLAAAIAYANQNNCHAITITVIRVRLELISWYERHGYQFTGKIIPFHDDKRFGIPKQAIELIEMEKNID